MLNFPQQIPVAAAHRGVTEARRRGARIVGAWLATEVDASPLEGAGFERGWEPWWMAAPLAAIAEPDDERVLISREVPEYDECGRRLLSLVEAPGSRAWHAVARVDGRLAGRAWAFAAGDLAGIYAMDVWPGFQRRGLGRALLRSVCDSARAARARVAVLNATPDASDSTLPRASPGSGRASPTGTISAVPLSASVSRSVRVSRRASLVDSVSGPGPRRPGPETALPPAWSRPATRAAAAPFASRAPAPSGRLRSAG